MPVVNAGLGQKFIQATSRQFAHLLSAVNLLVEAGNHLLLVGADDHADLSLNPLNYNSFAPSNLDHDRTISQLSGPQAILTEPNAVIILESAGVSAQDNVKNDDIALQHFVGWPSPNTLQQMDDSIDVFLVIDPQPVVHTTEARQ